MATDVKTCSRCGEEKQESEFPKNSTKRGGLQSRCKKCAAADQRARYAANPERHREAIEVRVANIRAVVNEIKSDPCMDCNQTFPPVCMDFDHVDGDKVDGISQMVRHGVSMSKVLAEIAKCEVVCANCHRIRTAERRDNVSRHLRVV